MKPLRPNRVLKAKQGHEGRDKSKWGRDEAVEAKRDLGGLNKAIEAGMRLLRPNEALAVFFFFF